MILIQLCEDSITLSLAQTFKSSLNKCAFPDTWKTGNIIPVHKREVKYLVKSYRPISFLPLFAKAFEILLFTLFS